MSCVGKPMRKVRLARLAGVPGGLGVIVRADGTALSDQLTSVPLFVCVSSTIYSCQVPAIFLPLKVDSGWSGRNVPVYGAVPPLIVVAPASSKTVFVKFWPLASGMFPGGSTLCLLTKR